VFDSRDTATQNHRSGNSLLPILAGGRRGRRAAVIEVRPRQVRRSRLQHPLRVRSPYASSADEIGHLRQTGYVRRRGIRLNAGEVSGIGG
jgi:hypothetical protein